VGRVAVTHASQLDDVLGIVSLMESDVTVVQIDIDAKVEAEKIDVAHLKGGLHLSLEGLHLHFFRVGDYEVVDIDAHQQNRVSPTSPDIDHVEQLCDTCVVTKLKWWPFPRQAVYHAQKQLELVHGDLCGPVMLATPGGRHYFLLLVDDASQSMWAVLLATKAAAADAIKHVQAAAKESGLKLQVLHTDNGGEFTAAEFVAYCADERIQRHYSVPYSLQQNGVVERRNQTVVAITRALLKQRGKPAVFWREAVMTAVHLINRSPTKSLEGKTPYETRHRRTPMVGHLRTFGCLAYAKELNVVSKLSDRSTSGVFIGYAEGVKAYRILDPVTWRVRTTRDVIFDEGRS
jgi:transposase InsO family protein